MASIRWITLLASWLAATLLGYCIGLYWVVYMKFLWRIYLCIYQSSCSYLLRFDVPLPYTRNDYLLSLLAVMPAFLHLPILSLYSSLLLVLPLVLPLTPRFSVCLPLYIPVLLYPFFLRSPSLPPPASLSTRVSLSLSLSVYLAFSAPTYSYPLRFT